MRIFLLAAAIAAGVSLADQAAGQQPQPFQSLTWDKGGLLHTGRGPWGVQEGYLDAVARLNRTRSAASPEWPLPKWCESACLAGLAVKGACLQPGATFRYHAATWRACAADATANPENKGNVHAGDRCIARAATEESLAILPPRIRAIVAPHARSSILSDSWEIDVNAIAAAGVPWCKRAY